MGAQFSSMLQLDVWNPPGRRWCSRGSREWTWTGYIWSLWHVGRGQSDTLDSFQDYFVLLLFGCWRPTYSHCPSSAWVWVRHSGPVTPPLPQWCGTLSTVKGSWRNGNTQQTKVWLKQNDTTLLCTMTVVWGLKAISWDRLSLCYVQTAGQRHQLYSTHMGPLLCS